MQVYIVLHHEIMGDPARPFADEMVFFVASSLPEAIRLIQRSHVSRWSWWEIQVQTLDKCEWPAHVGFYGRRGGKLRRPPFQRCLECYQREGRF